MKSQENIEEVLSQLNAMRAFFQFSDEILPFLNDLFAFLKAIAPLMLELNNSLHDSTVKLPTASDRIEDVNNATEFATMEILDALDRISTSIGQLPDLTGQNQTTRISELHDEVTNIVNALQFQDITSQKLSHANKILNVIFDRFSQLFEDLENAKLTTAIGGAVLESIDFGSKPDLRAKQVELLDEQTRDDIRENKISEQDIDAIFNQHGNS